MRVLRRTAALAGALAALLVAASSVRAEDPAAPKEPGRGAEPAPPQKPAPTETRDLLAMMKSADPVLRRAGAAEAAADPDPSLTAPLAKLLNDEALEVRLAAAASLARRTDDAARRTAAAAAADRLARLGEKGDPAEREALVAALHDLAQPSAVKALLDGIQAATAREEVAARLRAVGNVPAAEAVEGLIDFLARGRGRGDWNQSARLALRYALRTDAGGADPDLWRAWWRENRRGFDFAAAAADRARERDEAAERERRRREAE